MVAGMVAGMVVGIAAKDIEDHAPLQYREGVARVGEILPHAVPQVFVAGIARLQLAQSEQGECGEHGPALPARALAGAIEAFDQQYLPALGLGQEDRGHVQPRPARQAHRQILGLDQVVQVGAGGELGDEIAGRAGQQGLGPGAANGGAVLEGQGQRGGQGSPRSRRSATSSRSSRPSWCSAARSRYTDGEA